MQVEASSHDGQYYHLSVPEALSKLYALDIRFVSTVDPLHKAGTVDTHIRKDSTYTWMIKIFATCKEVFNKFNWGKNYELLVDTCQELENNMAQLVTFQTTRFANSIRLVVINLRTDYEAVVHCLIKIQDYLKHSSDSKDVEKRNDAKRLLNLIKNKRFCMHLSGLADIYNMFGMFVNVVQKVNVLPHERYDGAVQVLDTMGKMIKVSSHEKCNNEDCLWPSYHKDVKEIVENGIFQNVKIDKNSSSAIYQTRFAQNAASAAVQTDPIKQTHDNLLLLLTRLEKDLRTEVFDESTVKLIEKIRFVTDLKSLAKEILKKGYIVVAAKNGRLFNEYVRAITSSLDDVPDEELRDSYRRFARILEEYVKTNDMKKITSMSILKDFLKTDSKLYEGVELVLHGIVCAAVKVSVESVVESLVSRYESHFNKN